MDKKYIQFLLNQFRLLSWRHKFAGFTLIELLVTIIMGSIVLSGLLSLVVQLLRTDQQEAVRSETQSEMQLALDYISRDVREAVYVYDGNCLQGQEDDPNTTANDYCPGVVNHISIPSNSLPILAFWKLEPLPDECQTAANQTNALCNPFLLSGRTYSLIVYFLAKNQSNPSWQGRARIIRYELAQFTNSGNSFENTSGYVNPTAAGTSFRTWPKKQENGSWVSLQAQLPAAGSDNALVDFVDDTGGGAANPCGSDYIVSPSSATLTANSFANIRSFYACVRVGNVASQQNQQQSGLNQDAIVFLQGNAKGKRGNDNGSFLPPLQTQVLGRGVVDKQPSQ